MNILIYYHAGCNDGMAAAAIVTHEMREIYPDAHVTHVGSYYQQPRTNPLEGQKIDFIFVVDFSFPYEVLCEMCKECDRVVLIDHHKSAEEDLIDKAKQGFIEKTYPKNLKLIFNQQYSGAVNAYRYFHLEPDTFIPHVLNIEPDTVIPHVLKLVEMRDLWQNSEESDAFSAGTRFVKAGIKEFEKLIYPEDPESGRQYIEALINIGRLINRYRAQEVERCVKQAHHILFKASPGDDEGVTVLAANGPRSITSELGSELAKASPSKIGCVYNINENCEWLLEFRSTEEGPNCSELAKKMGGGGHHHAAGCKIKPWLHDLKWEPPTGALIIYLNT